MAVFVSFGGGSPEDVELHREQLEETWRDGGTVRWTVNGRAQPGDQLLFYFRKPESAFIALGRVAEIPALERKGPWAGKYMADVHVEAVFRKPVHHSEIRRRFPAWGFSRRPTDAQVPEELVPELFGLLGLAPSSSERPPKIAGFSTDPEQKRQVEQAAVSFVTERFQRNGWCVTDRQADRCGYDLLCRRGDEELHLEIKGTGGCDAAFLLTEGEVAWAKRDPCFRLCLVTDALGKPVLHTDTAAEMFETFELRPLEYRATLRSGQPPT